MCVWLGREQHLRQLILIFVLFVHLEDVWFFFFSSLIIPYSFFVTTHSSLKIPQIPKSYPFGNCFHFTSLKYFNLFVGLIPKLSVRPFCYFNIVPLPFTPSTKCLSHHSLPLLLVLKKSKLKKLKQKAKNCRAYNEEKKNS